MKLTKTTVLAALVMTLAAPAFARGIQETVVKGGTTFTTTAESRAIAESGPQR